jgi:hypothetical protein
VASVVKGIKNVWIVQIIHFVGIHLKESRPKTTRLQENPCGLIFNFAVGCVDVWTGNKVRWRSSEKNIENSKRKKKIWVSELTFWAVVITFGSFAKICKGQNILFANETVEFTFT